MTPLSPEEKKALLNGNTIERDGEKLNFEQWIVKRVNETSLPPRSEFWQWFRQYYELCKNLSVSKRRWKST
jgi:hypothetical protein